MTNASTGHIRISGRSFDLKEYNAVKTLLSSRAGRKAIEKWMNYHQNSPHYPAICSNVSSLTEGVEGVAESMIATATIATCIMSPALSSSQTNRAVFSGTCKVCHVVPGKKPINIPNKEEKFLAGGTKEAKEFSRRTSLRKSEIKELTFIALGSRGQGVKAVGEVREGEGSVAGKVGAARLAFRDERGIRLVCEFGKYPPKGAEVLLGSKSYRMWKGGVQWNMRNVLSINGIPTSGNVFIAEYFVKPNAADTNSLQVRNKKDRIKEIQERYALAQAKTPETSLQAPPVQDTADKEINSGKAVDSVAAAEKTQSPSPEPAPAEKEPVNSKAEVKEAQSLSPKQEPLVKEEPGSKPEYVYYQAREPEKAAEEALKTMVDNVSRTQPGIAGDQEACGTVQYFGGLTVCHVFTKNPDSDTTQHEAYLKAYPKIAVKETLNVPLTEVQKNTSKYTRGIDRRFETDMLLLINKELAAMFGDYTTRRLPAPDGRLVTGAKIVGEDEYFKYIYIHLYFSFNNGQWVALNDDFLVKIMRSEPLPSYMAVGTR